MSVTSAPQIYSLSLHDALPILAAALLGACGGTRVACSFPGIVFLQPIGLPPQEGCLPGNEHATRRSEEHTSELQSQSNLVCRLLLEKKKKIKKIKTTNKIN